MHRFRKKSETRRPQLIDDLFDFTPTSPSPSTSTSTTGPPPALPALSTGLEFRTSLIFPDLTRHFTAAGRAANISESKIRSRLAQQRAHGAQERITEEEEQLMFSALNSIQGFRRRGNSTSSAVDVSVDLQYPESVSSSKSSGPSLTAFPETPEVQDSIYPFASLNAQSSTPSSSKRHSNNLFSSSRFRDANAMKGVQRNRSLSSSTNSQDSIRAAPLSSDNENASDLNGVPEESSSDSPSSSQVEAITTQQLSDKDKTPTARISRLPIAPRLPNGNTLTVAQIRRVSMALERAISAIVETEHEADDDEEQILAPYAVPLGGAYPNRRLPTASNDPSNPIQVADLNAMLILLAESEKGPESGIDTSRSDANIAAPVPVSRTPGYVPGMNRPISPRDMGHESEDYSTTPRATSPVTPFGRGGPYLTPSRRQANGNGRPSTAPTRTGVSNNGSSSDWQRQGSEAPSTGLDRSYSSGKQYSGRYQATDLRTHGSNLNNRRPSSPLAQEPTQAAANGSSFVSSNSLSKAPISVTRSAQPAGDNYVGSSVSYLHEQEPTSDPAPGIQREKSITRTVTGPALPDSPLIDEINFRSYFPPIPAALTWGVDSDRHQRDTGPQNGIFMPQPTAHRPPPQSSTPTIIRSQTPNNLAKASNPITVTAVAPPVTQISTPSYLLQRSPSANGYHLDEQTQDTAVRRTISPRPTPSHTPSNSSNSAYNPLIHSSMGGSSRSSIGSARSSYHSSEEETNGKYKEVSNWLFDPESKGSVFVSAKIRSLSESGGSSKDDLDSKDDALDSIGDQEDVLELLTGLTKKDFATIQQKLVSTAVAKEAEEAIRLSQRRRRPSVQSREFVGSPTPKPITIVNVQPEPSIVQIQPPSALAASLKRAQSPAPETRREPEPEVAKMSPEPPMIVARPLSPVDEPASDFVDVSEEFKVHSAATTPPPEDETQEPTPIDQSPRAKALAEALFGAELVTPTTSSPQPNRSADELQEEVEKKVLAATVALKSPSLNVETSSPLRRKSTKRIDLQKISGPHLVSASMSVDAIPLASPSLTSLGASSPIDASKGGSKIGDRLRRLRGSLRTKTHASSGHERDLSSSSTVIREPTSSGTTQVVDYDPQAVQAPQIKSVPPHMGRGFVGSPPKAVTTSPGLSSPPASAGPAGLKGFITRLRQPKVTARRGDSSPARPAVSMQPSAFLSSPHLNDTDSPGMLGNTRSPMASHADISSRSPGQEPHGIASQGQAETAIRQLFAAAGSLGVDSAALNELLQRTAMQTPKQPNWAPSPESRPGTSTQRYEDSSNSSWVTGQLSRTPSRQPSTRTRIEATPRARSTRENLHPVSGVVRRTIIYPSSVRSASPLPGQSRGATVQRKISTSSNNKRRPISIQSQSSKSVHERVPTPPPPRGAAARRASEDGFVPPIPASASSNGRPSTSAGIIYDGLAGSSRRSVDIPGDHAIHEDGRALQMVELENGEIIWSILDTLRDDVDDESQSAYFPSRGSYASQYSGPDETVQVAFRGLGRSTSRTGNGNNGGVDDVRPETKVFYSDAKEIARLISQITNVADYGAFTVGTAVSARSSEELPVEDQLERLLHRLQEDH